MIPQITALKFEPTPDFLIVALAVFVILAGAIWLQHYLERRGIK